MIASNAAGSSGTSAVATATPQATPPASAAVLTATPGAEQVALNWTAVPGATGYIIQRSDTSGGPYTYLTSSEALSYTDSSLADNTTYYYVVSAMNSGGSSDSNEASATTAPAAPLNLSAIAGNTQVILRWSASVAAASYQVRRATTTGGPYTTVGTNVAGITFTDNGLTNGVTYFYVVAATNGNGTGLNSSEATVTPLASVPLAPANLTASGGNLKVVLNWTASISATSYSILRSSSSGGPYFSIASGIAANTYADSGLTNGVPYYYVVAAAGAGGSGAYSNEASATPVPPVTPNLEWSGTASTSWDTSTLNWLSGTTAAAYTDGYAVTFDDTASPHGTVVIGSTVAPASVTFNDSALNYSLSGAAISGTTSLVKTGSGTVTLSSSNSYTGDRD